MALNTEVIVTANTRGAEQQIQQLTNKNYGIKLNFDSQPLGRITGQLSEFNKSLDAANARVVAFGASAGAIAVLEKTFKSLINSTVEVQKSLKDIQVVLDASDAVINKFGKSLFDVAKNTGQSFSAVAEAATEFSRQGLSMEDTLRRTSEALILSRLSGMSAAQSVQTLTATVNSFASQAVTATEVVNKFANVDAAFAVSSKDLAEGISRVGASAAQSGVSIDELIALVTSAQQVTARGGAVIGNSLKTIFTRLERGKTQDLLESLGVSTKDSEGKLKNSIEMLKDLASVYSSLNQGKQAEVAEKVGGVFQINILKAALGDLGKQYSVYDNALKVSASSTDEAIQRNEKLNETYAAQINRLQQGATQLAASAGKQVFGPSMDRIIGAGNGIVDSLNNVDSSSIGAKLGKGILDGIGQILAGPGLVMIGGVIIKLLGDFSKFAGGSVKELLGLNGASKEQAAIQASITKLLEKNPSLLAQINSEAKTQNDQAKILLDFYTKQTAQMQLQAKLTAEVASKVYSGGVRMGEQGVPVKKKADGYIPEFASEEAQARMLGAKNPRAMWGSGTIGGQRFIKNSEETEIVGYGSNGDSAVIPKYAAGWVPNFAVDANGEYIQGTKKRKAQRSTATSRKGQGILRGEIDAAGFAELLVPIEPRESIAQSVSKNDRDILVKNIAVRTFKQGAIKEESRKDAGKIVETIADASFPAITDYINNLSPLGSPPLSKQDLENSFKQGSDAKGAYGALQAFAGSAFESGITKAIGYHAEKSNANQGDFDVRGGTNLKLLQELFGLGTKLGDFKISDSTGNLLSFAAKVVKEKGGRGAASKIKKAAAGYIPNFADALHDSIAREISAGAPASDIYIKKYGQLASANNPDGYGVFNKRDEGSMSKEMRAIRRKGYASGYIPNFADDGSVDGSGGLVSGGASALVNIAFAMSLFKNNSKEATEATKQKAETLAKEKEAQIQSQQAIIKAKEAFIEAKKGAQGMADSVRNASRDIDFANQKIKELSRLSLGQKIGQIKDSVTSSGAYQGANKFLSGRGGTALTFAPIIAEQAASLIPQNSQGGRGASQAVSSLGTVASYAGAGAMLGGPVGAGVGAGVGAAAGAIIEIPKVIKAFTDKLPELTAQLDKAKDSFNKFKGPADEYLKASDELNSAIENGSANQEVLTKLIKARAEALAKLPVGDQANILEARNSGGFIKERDYIVGKEQSGINETSRLEKAKKNEEISQAAAGTYLQRFFGGANKNSSQFIGAVEGVKSQIFEGLADGKTGKEAQEKISKIDTSQLDKIAKSQNPIGDLEQFLKSNNISQDVINNAGGVGRTVGGSEEIAQAIKKYIEDTKRAAAATEQAAAIQAESAPKIIAENAARQQNASAIEKQIGLIQAATAAYESRMDYDQKTKSTQRKFSTEMSQTRTSNIEEVIGSITGQTMQGTREQYSNKISNVQENAANEKQDILEQAGNSMVKDVNKLFMGVYEQPKKKSGEAPGEMYEQGEGITKLMSNRFDTEANATSQPRDVREGKIAAVGKDEIMRQQGAGENIKNALQQYGEGKTSTEDFQAVLTTEFSKLVDSGKADSQQLQNLVHANVQKGEELKKAVKDVQTSASNETKKLQEEMQKMVVLQGLMASTKTFGGGMAALETGKTTSTPELAGLLGAGAIKQKNKEDKQRLINSGLELSSADVGNRGIAENYMKVNRVLRDKYQGGMPSGTNIGSAGAGGAEGMMVSEIQKAMTKDLEQTRKSFKGKPQEYQEMNTKAENAMIVNATARKAEDVDKLSGKDRDAALTEAIKNIALVKVAQETGDRTLLTKGGAGGIKDNETAGLLSKMFENNKTPDEKLLAVQEESAATLKDIYEAIKGNDKGVEEMGKDPAVEQFKAQLSNPVNYNKYPKEVEQVVKAQLANPVDYKFKEEEQVKAREADRQGRIQKVARQMKNAEIYHSSSDNYNSSLRGINGNNNKYDFQFIKESNPILTDDEAAMIGGLKSGYLGLATARVDKQMAKEDAQKKQQQEKQQKEAAGGQTGGGQTGGGQTGGGNVSVSAPINVNVNIGGGGAGGTQAQVNAKMPEFNAKVQASVAKIATEMFQLKDRVDRMSLGGNGANIPVTKPASQPATMTA